MKLNNEENLALQAQRIDLMTDRRDISNNGWKTVAKALAKLEGTFHPASGNEEIYYLELYLYRNIKDGYYCCKML